MSTFKLYSSANTSAGAWKLIPSKLFKVDGIADYLATFTPTTITDAQYIKQGLEISIKVNMTQDKSQPNSASGFKYVSIQNDNERIAYYYVRKAAWRSANTVEFQLVMDVLNTYNDGSDYVFKANTRILREHKPRFYLNKWTLLLVVNNALETGVVSVGDNVTLSWYDNQDDDWRFICNGTIETWNGDDFVLTLAADINRHDVELAIKNNIRSGNDFLVRKNVGNEVMARFDSYTLTSDLYRNIDFISENINPLLIRDSSNAQVEESSILGQDWYLLYRNQNDPTESLVNPVNCYLIPANLTKVNVGSLVNGAIVPSTLNSGMYYYLNVRDMNNEITLSNGVSLPPNSYNQPNMVIVKKQANGLLNVVFVYDPVNVNLTYTRTYNDIEYITINHFPLYYYESATQIDTEYWIDNIMGNETDSWDENSVEVYIDNISLLDRTDPKNIKLIKLPYCPYDFELIGDKLQIVSTQWSYVSLVQANGTIHVLKLDDLNVKLQNNIDGSSLNPFGELHFGETTPSVEDLRMPKVYESKLYHSEFYAPTFVYDSFSLHIDLERCKLSNYIDNYNANNIVFTMTSTINSKFLFAFASYVADKNVENFYNIIPVARNNEMVLYNVSYLNYVRSSFNYDIKQKNISNASNFLGLGLSGLSVAASFALPSVPLKALGIVASIVGLANSIKSTITETIKNEESLKQKLIQAQNQTSSVAGSDDVDLMSEYCDNRLKYFIYKPTDNMINLIYDLFFYAGYNSGRMGVPNHNTRVNFDYLECDASLESAGANIPQEILEEIKNSYKTGVTFIHRTSRVSDKWDIEQKYENWEKELVEG